MNADTMGKEVFSGVFGSVKAAAELYAALCEKYPTENMFVDTSAGPGGMCKVELFGDGYDYAVAISYHKDDVYMYALYINKDIDGAPDSLHASAEAVLIEIARLRGAQ